jgi:hypothetical protein
LATRPFAETKLSENVQQDFIFDVVNNIFKITIFRLNFLNADLVTHC